MDGELASVQGIVDLSPQEALDSAEGFLASQGYIIEQRTFTTVFAQRQAEGEEEPLSITVAVAPQAGGGVRLTIRGSDQAGIRERQAAWTEWSESLPKKPEPQIEEAGERTVEVPEVELPPTPQPRAVDVPDPPVAPTVTVTSPRRESTVWRGTKLAFGGCVVLPALLLIGFVGCLAIVASGGGGGGDGGGSESSKNKRPTVGINEPLRVGQVTWTVTSARQATQLEEKGFGKYGDTKEGNFIIVDFSFENNSRKSITLDPSELTLIDSKDRRSKPDEDTLGYVPADRDIIYEQVNPGVTREGEVIFTVAPGATDYRLQAGDAIMFTGRSGIVNLSSQP